MCMYIYIYNIYIYIYIAENDHFDVEDEDKQIRWWAVGMLRDGCGFCQSRFSSQLTAVGQGQRGNDWHFKAGWAPKSQLGLIIASLSSSFGAPFGAWSQSFLGETSPRCMPTKRSWWVWLVRKWLISRNLGSPPMATSFLGPMPSWRSDFLDHWMRMRMMIGYDWYILILLSLLSLSFTTRRRSTAHRFSNGPVATVTPVYFARQGTGGRPKWSELRVWTWRSRAIPQSASRPPVPPHGDFSEWIVE